jgi:hypothetical protein
LGASDYLKLSTHESIVLVSHFLSQPKAMNNVSEWPSFIGRWGGQPWKWCGFQ